MWVMRIHKIYSVSLPPFLFPQPHSYHQVVEEKETDVTGIAYWRDVQLACESPQPQLVLSYQKSY